MTNERDGWSPLTPYCVGDVISFDDRHYRVIGKYEGGWQFQRISKSETRMWRGIQRAMRGWRFAI